jgi:ankyrin repeat protein
VEDPYQDTFSWLFDSDIGFTDWLKSWPPRPIFWVQGKPGSGKSTLMKYASTHDKTQSLLDSTPATPWTLITFFFHDRGSAIQRTVDGLLQEVLYQLLKAYPDLVQFLVPIRIQAVMDSGAKTRDAPRKGKVMDIGQLAKLINPEDLAADSDSKKTRKAGRMWDPQEIEEGLSAVTSQSEVAMNVCIFIDALDEHNGNHRRLVQILQSLTTNSGLVNIKLCLASRPEPIFQDIYSVHPGFAIHEHTEKDVKEFAFGKIESSLTSRQDEKELELLRQLSEDITLKASGVFIWVKLVVEELVERVVDGSTVAQLQRVLSSIPDELQALYQRVIHHRKPEYALEFYIMIQIILRSRTPQTLSSLMAATDLALFGMPETSTTSAMERRLASRSGGLLELANSKSAKKLDSGPTFSPSSQRRRNTTKAANYRAEPQKDSKKSSFEVTVQFLHQTVKSFFEIRENATAMFSNPKDVPTENGWTYHLRYCVHIATEMPITGVGMYARNLLDLFPYAADLEVTSGNGAVDILDSLLVRAKCSQDLEMSGKVADKVDGLHVWEHFCMETNFPIYYDSIHVSARQYDLIVFAAAHGLVQYVKSKLRSDLPSTPRNRVPLLYAACCSALADVWAHESLEGNNAITMQSVKLIHLLLEKGADPNAASCGITPLGFLIRSCSSADAGSLLAASWEVVFECIELLLRHGADPNIPIGSLRHTAPLCFALLSPKNAVRLARLLLKNGADHKIRDKDGFYALYYTIDSGNMDTTELLLEYGADPTDVGHGINVLDLASYKGNKVVGGLMRSVKVMESLLENYRPVRESKPLPPDGNVDISEEPSIKVGDNVDEILKPPPEYKTPMPQHSW